MPLRLGPQARQQNPFGGRHLGAARKNLGYWSTVETLATRPSCGAHRLLARKCAPHAPSVGRASAGHRLLLAASELVLVPLRRNIARRGGAERRAWQQRPPRDAVPAIS